MTPATEQTPYHIPALLPQTIEALDIRPNGTYIDATLGGAGHTSAILSSLGPKGHLYSFDQDPEAIARAPHDPRFTPVLSNFRYITNFMAYYGVDHVDGILADLGVSFHHFDDPERGFSFRWDDSPLDMRMNTGSGITAAQILNEATQQSLTDTFRTYGEFRNASRLAADIVRRRSTNPLQTSADLRNVALPHINPRQERRDLACIYQALRIVVNDELSALRHLLDGATRLLQPGGRLAIITYHSLEDRIVKNYMRTGNIDGHAQTDSIYGGALTPYSIPPQYRRPIVPDEAETEANPRSRSAKLRVATRI